VQVADSVSQPGSLGFWPLLLKFTWQQFHDILREPEQPILDAMALFWRQRRDALCPSLSSPKRVSVKPQALLPPEGEDEATYFEIRMLDILDPPLISLGFTPQGYTHWLPGLSLERNDLSLALSFSLERNALSLALSFSLERNDLSLPDKSALP
jgi:hypothetical protein